MGTFRCGFYVYNDKYYSRHFHTKYLLYPKKDIVM